MNKKYLLKTVQYVRAHQVFAVSDGARGPLLEMLSLIIDIRGDVFC